MQAKQISDIAEAARVYLERTNASVETVNRATEVRVLAERQMGVFLKEMPKATGTAGEGRPSLGGRDVQPPKEDIPTLKQIGITKDQSSRAQKLAAIPEEEFNERISVAKASRGKLTTLRRTKIAARRPLRTRGGGGHCFRSQPVASRSVRESNFK